MEKLVARTATPEKRVLPARGLSPGPPLRTGVVFAARPRPDEPLAAQQRPVGLRHPTRHVQGLDKRRTALLTRRIEEAVVGERIHAPIVLLDRRSVSIFARPGHLALMGYMPQHPLHIDSTEWQRGSAVDQGTDD